MTEDGWHLLSSFYEIDWDGASFGELRGVGSGERAKIPRLQEALILLLELGAVVICRTNDDRVDEVLLEGAKAVEVIRATEHWTLPDEPGFDPSVFYEARPTTAAQNLYWIEREAGRPMLPPEEVVLK